MVAGKHRHFDDDGSPTATRARSAARRSDCDDFTTMRAGGEVTTPVVSGHAAASDEQVVGLVATGARETEYFAHASHPYGLM